MQVYMCIDLKSFYASVECVERGLDPMTENLIVADPERTDKTICLAVTPAMKKLGVKNRCRVFEIPGHIKYVTAEPRMKLYVDYSAKIYAVYLKYFSKDDIHVYSIDEVFIDATHYLSLYGMKAAELAQKIMEDVYETVGIRAACGIGTNMYLAKIALDITAKHSENFIGCLTEETYRKYLWNHRPLTDFWRVGPGTAKKLEKYGIYTMEQIAAANEEFLYSLFGIDAELIIDHAWGRETATIEDIKSYKSKTKCITSGQVLMHDYGFEDAEIIVKEMAEALCLSLVDKGLVTKSVTLRVGYSNSLKLKSASGTVSLDAETNSDMVIVPSVAGLYRRIVNPIYPVRRVNICFNRVTEECCRQTDFFGCSDGLDKNYKIQKTILEIKKQFGKNSVLRGIDLTDAATARDRNNQIGGHKSGEQTKK